MKQDSIFFTAKNDRQFELRTPRHDEARASIDMIVEVAAHSPYILSTPESFKQRTTESQGSWFNECANSDSSIIIAAYYSNRMIGFCDGRGYKDIKRKHRAALGVSILPDFRGCGLGYKMMEVLISKMKQFNGIKIIELDVMLNNTPAIKMYEKLEFQRGGIFPKAFILPSGEISDNLTMFMYV